MKHVLSMYKVVLSQHIHTHSHMYHTHMHICAQIYIHAYMHSHAHMYSIHMGAPAHTHIHKTHTFTRLHEANLCCVLLPAHLLVCTYENGV